MLLRQNVRPTRSRLSVYLIDARALLNRPSCYSRFEPTNKAGHRRREGFCALLSSSIKNRTQRPSATCSLWGRTKRVPGCPARCRADVPRTFLAALATFSIPGRLRHISSQYLRTIWTKFEPRYSISVSRASVNFALQQPSE